MSGSYPLQGVLAVNKPSGITSVDVLRTLQEKFNPSTLFAPLIAHAAKVENSKQQRGRRSRVKAKQVKIGHGGTLDPLATGVLIAGLGDGTKSLSSFLACKKTYETVVVFGVETDTYDVLGQVTGQRPTDGISKSAIEDALEAFRGKIKQKPPVYSARWVNGERLYDLARRGQEIPEGALQEREVQVDDLQLLDFWDASDHKYVMRSGEALQSKSASKRDEKQKQKQKQKGKRQREESPSPPPASAKQPKIEDLQYVTARDVEDPRDAKDPEEVQMTGALPATATDPASEQQQDHTKEDLVGNQNDQVALGPAARIRMTVSSGFYVRSLCHDLGKALDSAGFMAELVRSRQGDFVLGKNVLEYEELAKDEEHWGGTVKSLLLDWQQQQQKTEENKS